MGLGSWLLGEFDTELKMERKRRRRRRMRRDRTRMAKSRKQEVQAQIEALEDENDEIKLYLAALIRHLSANGKIKMEEFKRLVISIDAEDGESDGQFHGPVVD